MNPGTDEFARRQRLFSLVESGSIVPEILDCIMPDGQPLPYETELWDYKAEIPDRGVGIELDDFCLKLVKHIVAFHNSYGGFIIFGVHDATKALIGCDAILDLEDINKRIRGYTKHRIPMAFQRVAVKHEFKIGVLWILQKAV